MAWKPLPFKMLNDRFDEVEKRLARLAKEANKRRYEKYREDPFAYAREVLKVEWWHRQQEVVEALLRPPYRVLVKASHSVGKSFLAGGLVNWFYDTHDPGVVITTAPTHRQVKDVLWKEVRRQRGNRPGFPGPKITRLEDSPTHFAVGFTAGTGTSFQGQHEAAVLIVLDEAVGIDRQIWEAADSMVMGVKYGIVAFCNPTDPTSEFYAREQSGLWTTIHIPCLEHPNILAELEGREPPYPSAVRLAWLEERLREYCRPVTESVEANDFEWPPNSGKWLRPGPLAEARLLGRWPSSSVGVWSDMLWQKCETCEPATDGFLPEIGLDVARFGDDLSEFHVRCGNASLHHEGHNGLDNAHVIGLLRRQCKRWAEWANERLPSGAAPIRPERILCKIDDDGMGGRIVDHAEGYNWVAVRAGSSANDPDQYPNKRSEMWFDTATRAEQASISLALLPDDIRRELKRQAMAPVYKLDAPGRRVVEPKEVTKKKLGRSPDGMDAVNLAYYEHSSGEVAAWVDTGNTRERTTWRDRRTR